MVVFTVTLADTQSINMRFAVAVIAVCALIASVAAAPKPV